MNYLYYLLQLAGYPDSFCIRHPARQICPMTKKARLSGQPDSVADPGCFIPDPGSGSDHCSIPDPGSGG
jgi:hypothetical protein